MKTYAMVGVMAVIAYAVLKPESQEHKTPAPSVQATYQTPEVSRLSLSSIPTTVTPAAATTMSNKAATTPIAVGPAEAVTTTGANVRSAPSMSGSIAKVLDAGTRVRVMAKEGTWRQVGDQNGEAWGWVHSSILR